MPVAPQRRTAFRFALPPSLGPQAARERADRMEAVLCRGLGRAVEVVVSPSYEVLTKDLLAGRLDAAWAPPFVCARLEAMGLSVLVRGVRRESSSYRAALVCRAGDPLHLDSLSGTSAVWVDRDSVGGYLLATAFLRGKGLDPAKLFFNQDFVGSYRAALEALHSGRADLTSVFAAPVSAGEQLTAIDEVWAGHGSEFRVVAFTDESPNDGVAVSVGAPEPAVAGLESLLLGLPGNPEGLALLRDVFKADRFEPAPRMGYRSLYRVAMASL